MIKRYKVPEKILDEYHEWGLCSVVQAVFDDWQYDDTDLERLSMIMALHDMGFTSNEVEHYMKLCIEGKSTQKERMKMLEKQRSKTLDEIHLKERQIMRMDYLRDEMKKTK